MHGCSYEYNSNSKLPYGIYAEGNAIQDIQIPNQWDDPGACGNGLQEAERCLVMGKLVAKYLTAVGYECILFQYDGLNTICKKENTSNADIFISIHCNAANSQALGHEVYYYYNDTTSKKLATTIYNQTVNSINITRRGVREAGFAVLRGTNAKYAVLVETAFIDNAYDANLLKTKYDDFARAIARGVTDLSI